MRKDLFCAIDLHSNNNYVAVIDSKDRRLLERRLKNDLRMRIEWLGPGPEKQPFFFDRDR